MHSTHSSQQQPEYVCALLTDERGWLVLQLRPSWAVHAADQLTCFGGKREAQETIADCLYRELGEETGWRPARIPTSGINLRCGKRWIACFIPLPLPLHTSITAEPGFVTMFCPIASLPGLPISPWHQAVISGWKQGAHLVEVP